MCSAREPARLSENPAWARRLVNRRQLPAPGACRRLEGWRRQAPAAALPPPQTSQSAGPDEGQLPDEASPPEAANAAAACRAAKSSQPHPVGIDAMVWRLPCEQLRKGGRGEGAGAVSAAMVRACTLREGSSGALAAPCPRLGCGTLIIRINLKAAACLVEDYAVREHVGGGCGCPPLLLQRLHLRGQPARVLHATRRQPRPALQHPRCIKVGDLRRPGRTSAGLRGARAA